ncbi:uncharacterized protein LOC113272082 [Papaver somniferum]|uniref:uncharacterized protein LOC113272082 n=1 Tax=Papaver somniferum TaxID=3469 RepID=UPI000E6FC338|nr:uncharacterized protein LOC113272082 [Papaver somniferum]
MIILVFLLIEKAWSTTVTGSPGFRLTQKLQTTRRDLSIWNRAHFGDINQKVDKLQKELNTLQEQPFTAETHDKIFYINKELEGHHRMKSEFYQQKSRDHFIKDMDTNIKYFHIKANRKKARNNIDSIRDHNNNWLHSIEEISLHLTDYFKSISTTTNPVLEERLFLVIPTLITDEHNALLTRIPSTQDIHSTLKSMENWSAPGPEGFQDGFYKSQ